MITTFAFHERPPPDMPDRPTFWRNPGWGGLLVLPLGGADRFDRRGYGDGGYACVVMTVRHGDGAAPAIERAADNETDTGVPHTVMTATCIRRLRPATGPTVPTVGDTMSGVVLVTLCDLAAADSDAFLAQFAAAGAYMAGRPGFWAARLYREIAAGPRRRFVNVALWRDLDAFVAAFSEPVFATIIVGGFETRSRIMSGALAPGGVIVGATGVRGATGTVPPGTAAAAPEETPRPAWVVAAGVGRMSAAPEAPR